MFCVLLFLVAINAESISFNVLQWNIFRRQLLVGADGQVDRARQIPGYIANQMSKTFGDVDVVTICEAWEDSDSLIAALKANGFSYSTTLLKDPNPTKSLTNGGVVIVSAHPIIRQDQMVYRDACHMADCLAAKGVKYARIEKTNNQGQKKVFNVFATHMQAWDTDQTHADRRKQAAQMQAFIRDNSISPTEPVILTGDFNSDLGEWIKETEALFSILQAKMPRNMGQNYTVNPSQNLLVGRDGGDDACSAAYRKSWGPVSNGLFDPSLQTRVPCQQPGSNGMCFCPCCPFQWLDYILWGTGYQQPLGIPTVQAIQAEVPKFPVPWERIGTTKLNLWDLSDHYPILAKFSFNYTSVPIVQDGCKNDADCDLFFPAYCYCTGPTCTLNGTKVNGRNYGPYDKVNSHCHFSGWNVECVCHF